MTDLARSFGDVADAYDLGRPRYPPDVLAAIAEHAGGPRILDVGAGTGRLSGPLSEAGYEIVAVEPLEGMRAILARAIGPERALEGNAEALPLPDASVDGAVCSDAWHWFDGRRAADELARVVRPGGGVVICVLWDIWAEDPGAAPRWWQETSTVFRKLWEAADHPHADGPTAPPGFDGHPAFAPVEKRSLPLTHRYPGREAILAHFASISVVASLAPEPRAATLAEIDAILERHGVDAVDAPYRADLWLTRRRPA